MGTGKQGTGDGDITQFRLRLAEAIAWCAGRGSAIDPANSLRTPALRPAVLDETRTHCHYAWGTVPERQALVRTLAEERARRLRWEGRYPAMPADDLAGGRLLIYDPDGNLSDGAAEERTRGFFDVENTPPWDTWLCYVHARDGEGWQPFDSYLISWVPPELVVLAEAGIQINPEECILWAGERDIPWGAH
jgi:hypothetical protein